jgi:PhoPQ-activated pathogenicity-related protein
MSRFYFNYDQRLETYAVFDRQWSNTTPIAWSHDVTIAEMIVSALNLFWERPQ